MPSALLRCLLLVAMLVGCRHTVSAFGIVQRRFFTRSCVRSVATADQSFLAADSHLPVISWYPGHIAKAERELSDYLKKVDVVIELRDARIPLATSHPSVPQWVSNKPLIVAVCRIDQISKQALLDWREYYAKNCAHANHPDTKVFFINSKTGEGVVALKKHALKSCEAVNERRVRRGIEPRAARAAIIGFPNVGKSALINRLLGKRMAKSRNLPGVTRSLQWIRIGGTEGSSANAMELLDSPGIIPAKHLDQHTALYLAICNDIGEASYDRVSVASAMCDEINRMYKNNPKYVDMSLISKRYSIPFAELTGDDILLHIADKYYMGNQISAADKLLSDFRKNMLGFGSLQSPDQAPLLKRRSSGDEDAKSARTGTSDGQKFTEQQELVKSDRSGTSVPTDILDIGRGHYEATVDNLLPFVCNTVMNPNEATPFAQSECIAICSLSVCIPVIRDLPHFKVVLRSMNFNAEANITSTNDQEEINRVCKQLLANLQDMRTTAHQLLLSQHIELEYTNDSILHKSIFNMNESRVDAEVPANGPQVQGDSQLWKSMYEKCLSQLRQSQSALSVVRDELASCKEKLEQTSSGNTRGIDLGTLEGDCSFQSDQQSVATERSQLRQVIQSLPRIFEEHIGRSYIPAIVYELRRDELRQTHRNLISNRTKEAAFSVQQELQQFHQYLLREFSGNNTDSALYSSISSIFQKQIGDLQTDLNALKAALQAERRNNATLLLQLKEVEEKCQQLTGTLCSLREKATTVPSNSLETGQSNIESNSALVVVNGPHYLPQQKRTVAFDCPQVPKFIGDVSQTCNLCGECATGFVRACQTCNRAVHVMCLSERYPDKTFDNACDFTCDYCSAAFTS